MDRIYIRCLVAFVGLLFLITLIPTRTQAGIGGQCPLIHITWSPKLSMQGVSGDVTVIGTCVIFETNSSRADNIYLKFRDNIFSYYKVRIKAGVCIWAAPKVSCTIERDDSGGKLTIEIKQGDYTDKSDAEVYIYLAD